MLNNRWLPRASPKMFNFDFKQGWAMDMVNSSCLISCTVVKLLNSIRQHAETCYNKKQKQTNKKQTKEKNTEHRCLKPETTTLVLLFKTLSNNNLKRLC